MNILKQVNLDKVSRRKDRSVSLTFITDLEQSSSELMEMDEKLGSRGLLYYTVKGDLTQSEIDELNDVDIEIEGKTKSQRLRAVLWRLQESELKRKPTPEEFRDYYSNKMEMLIEYIKDKLD